jgi:ADP-ribose pyrophosphatase
MKNIVFRGRVFSVEVADERSPDGAMHTVEIVRHARSVVLIPVEADGRVILVRQFRAPLGRMTWEFPAGGVNPGESADAAAMRECEEETGRAPRRIERIHALYPAPGYCDEELVFYRVSDLASPAPDSPHKPDPDENIEARTLTVREARAMVERGEIVDLKSAYALTLL